MFSTAADNQPSVDVHVLQGERSMAADNRSLGRFVLEGIAPAPRGIPQIEVSFDIDANGILNVKAKDKGTGKEQKITIQASSGLSDEEIEKMKKDAEAHVEEDKKKKESVDAKNEGESLAYSTEKLIKDNGDKIPEDKKKSLEEGIKSLREALQSDDIEKIKPEEKKDDKVVDAEFTEVDDSKEEEEKEKETSKG